MKELSIEQKAKRYDEAIKEASVAYKDEDRHLKATLERIFPELKESEDEKIRKLLIRLFTSNANEKFDDVSTQEIIAWLEEQGEHADINPSEFDLHLNKLLKQFETLPKEELVSSLSFYLNVIQNDGTYKPDEKQGEQKHKFIIGDIISNNNVIYRVDNIVKNCIGQDCYFLVDIESEKRGIRYLIMRDSEGKTSYMGETTWLCDQVDAKFEKQGEKHTDKIEPKFHEGEWIVWQDKYYKVNYNGCGYELIDQNGLRTSLEYGTVDEDAHIFGIADAKDGDVLVDMHGNIGIFQECGDIFWHSYIYLGCDGKLRGFSIGGSHERTDTHPATHFQRDILINAMTDAGYMFDFEKKELKKLGQHLVTKISDQVKGSAWGEEDECYMSECIGAIATKDGWSSEEKRKTKKWLQSLKQRIGG